MKDYILFDSKGFGDYEYWQDKDRKIVRQINKLIQSIRRDGVLGGTGKAEVLSGNYKGCYSRRIDDKNRLIYNVSSDNDVRKTLIVSCREHYPDNVDTKQKDLLRNLHIYE